MGTSVVQYEIVRDDEDFIILYDYPLDSADAVQGIARGMHLTAAQWATEGRTFKAIVVFKKGLSLDDFRRFMEETGAPVHYTTARATTIDNGQTVSVDM